MENSSFDMKENGCTNPEVLVTLLNLSIFATVESRSLFLYNKHLEGRRHHNNFSGIQLKYRIDFLFHRLHQKNQVHCLFLKFPKMQVVLLN